LATITESTISANKDEGLDLDENGYGEINIVAIEVEASENIDENIKITQFGDGNITAFFSLVTAKNSKKSDGIKLESFDNSSKDENLAGENICYYRKVNSYFQQ